ncbi:MAG: hypothetical protein ABFR62_01330 [Bacteroidota bacterium]
MKTLIFRMLVSIIVISVCSCSKDDTKELEVYPDEVVELVSSTILEELEGLKMTINRGDDPPAIEGTYIIGPCEFDCSNLVENMDGCYLPDIKVSFYNHVVGDKSLVISHNYCFDSNYEGGKCDSSKDTYIMGEGRNFTVFSRITMHKEVNPAVFVCVISGTIIEEGIVDTKVARFMYDDLGDPLGSMMEVGKGIIFFDSDGLSERIVN